MSAPITPLLDRPHCSVCGKYCWGDVGTAEEPVTVDGETVCGECAGRDRDRVRR
jgi:hypothetical protein